jgi:hypothetical protein
MRSDQKRREGVVLLVVLVFIYLLTVIVSLFISDVNKRIQYRVQTGGDRDMRKIAYQYLEHTLGILEEFNQLDQGLSSPVQGWRNPLGYEPFPIEYPGIIASVFVEDLSGKIPLKQLDEANFLIYLESLGINGFDGAALRDTYFDWTDSDEDSRIQGAEKLDYERDRELFLLPRNAAIKNLDEFAYIQGFHEWVDPNSRFYDPEMMEVFKGSLTLLHDRSININSASPSVLEFLRIKFNLNPRSIEDYLSGRDRILGTEDDRMIELGSENLPPYVANALGDGSDPLLGSLVHTLRISIELSRFELAGFRLEAVVQITQSNQTPSIDPSEDGTDSQDSSSKVSITDSSAGNSAKPNTTKGFEILVINEKLVKST